VYTSGAWVTFVTVNVKMLPGGAVPEVNTASPLAFVVAVTPVAGAAPVQSPVTTAPEIGARVDASTQALVDGFLATRPRLTRARSTIR
jgi:hypothetical protein